MLIKQLKLIQSNVFYQVQKRYPLFSEFVQIGVVAGDSNTLDQVPYKSVVVVVPVLFLHVAFEAEMVMNHL